jgi:hypothetical protein
MPHLPYEYTVYADDSLDGGPGGHAVVLKGIAAQRPPVFELPVIEQPVIPGLAGITALSA